MYKKKKRKTELGKIIKKSQAADQANRNNFHKHKKCCFFFLKEMETLSQEDRE